MTDTHNPLAEAIEAAQSEVYMPKGYTIKDGQTCIDKDGNWMPFCDPLYVTAMTRAKNGQENWGRLLEFTNADGHKIQWAMPNAMLSGEGREYRSVLLDKGFHTRGGRKAETALHNYLVDAKPPARAMAVPKPGWHSGQYVGSDGTVYGPNTSERILLQMASAPQKPLVKGTLQEWQNTIGTYAVDNSRLTLAICVALAGPLLKLAGAESAGFHLAGASSCGKSTALDIAASVWGVPKRSWRQTDNGAEGVAERANDGFLALDEMGEVEGRALDAMAYMLLNGQGKTRASKMGEARDAKTWGLILLSSGEVGAADKLAEVGRRYRAGQAVRLLEIPADVGKGHGLFENLHGHDNGAIFSVALKAAAEAHCGHIAPAFLQNLVTQSPENLCGILAQLRKAWCAAHVPQEADAQVNRAAGHFALMAVAGHLAAHWGILPWPKEWASRAMGHCFCDWLAERGGTGSHEVQEGLDAIQNFIDCHGGSRFEVLGGDNRLPPRERAGFVKKDTEVTEYLIFSHVMQNEILSGIKDKRHIIKAAAQKGLCVLDGDHKPPKREVPGLGRQRVYIVRMDREGLSNAS